MYNIVKKLYRILENTESEAFQNALDSKFIRVADLKNDIILKSLQNAFGGYL